MLICYNQNEGAIIGMKQYTKEEVTALSNEELLHYINYLLKNGYSLSQLERDKVATRKTISNKLKKIGYITIRLATLMLSVQMLHQSHLKSLKMLMKYKNLEILSGKLSSV